MLDRASHFTTCSPVANLRTWWATMWRLIQKNMFFSGFIRNPCTISWIMLSICSPVGTRPISRLFSARNRSWDSKNIPGQVLNASNAHLLEWNVKCGPDPIPAPTHIPRSESVNVKPGTWHLLSIKLETPPSPFFTFPETSCVRNFPGSQFN